MKFQFKAKKITKGGVPSLEFPTQEYKKAISELADDSYVLISISDQRTLLQNNLLHSIISEVSSYTGESLDDLKAFFKHKFLGYVEHEVTDYECLEDIEDCEKVPIKKTVQELRSTTTLTKKEFGDFITQIQSWAWENLSLNLSNIPEE